MNISNNNKNNSTSEDGTVSYRVRARPIVAKTVQTLHQKMMVFVSWKRSYKI